MSNFVPIFIGSRYSRGRNRNRFGSIVGLFSLIGMALGVCALILVLSVMNGFNAEIAGRLQTLAPDLTLTPKIASTDARELEQFLSEDMGVAAVSPVVESFVMLSTDRLQRPMKLIGIDSETDAKVAQLSGQLVDGELEQLLPGEFGIILGAYAASSLLVGTGDSLKVVLPKLRMTPAGLFPRQKNFRVIGIFDSGSQLDADFSYVHIQDAQRVLGLASAPHGWRVKLDDVSRAEAVAEEIQKEQLGWAVQTWKGDYQSLFQAMKMEKITVGALLMIIVLVAAFNIISGLIMMVSDKRSDMAVLRTMGASSATVIRIFMVQGLILGLAGILVGAALGTFLAFNLSRIVSWFERIFGGSLFDPTVFYVSFLPSEWHFGDFLWVLLCATFLTLVATLVPSIQAAKISPREALNYKQ